MSERRFLIFTKRGPIEIHFKLSHYVSLALTIVVGVSSIIYYSVVGISSATDVAQNDIITEASANLPARIKENNSKVPALFVQQSIRKTIFIISNNEK